MAGYIGNKSQTLVDGYSQAAADAEFVNDPNSVITVSGNSVGIGVTNPDTPLVVANGMKTVVSDSGIHNAVRMDNSYASGITAGAAITWQQDGNIKSSIEANTYGSDYMSFKVNGNVERMRIDSAGRVTMPYQPMFHAVNSTASYWTPAANTAIEFNHIYENVGNHFNGPAGAFTAPVAGVYYFSIHIFSQNASNDRFGLYVNGGAKSEPYLTGVSNYDDGGVTQSGSMVIRLQANDVVTFGTPYGNTEIYGRHSGVTGCLLG